MSRKHRARKQQRAQSSRKYKVVGLDGDPCPRCGQATEIREHTALSDRHLNAPYYFTRWFNCLNPACDTKLIMQERFKVKRGERVLWC
jgi:hypothetical protein